MARTLRRALAATALATSLLTATAPPVSAAPPTAADVCIVILVTPDGRVYIVCIPLGARAA